MYVKQNKINTLKILIIPLTIEVYNKIIKNLKNLYFKEKRITKLLNVERYKPINKSKNLNFEIITRENKENINKKKIGKPIETNIKSFSYSLIATENAGLCSTNSWS